MTAPATPTPITKIPTPVWVFFQVLLPLLPIFVGILIIFFIESQLTMFELFKGVVFGLLALSLLANCVCALFGNSAVISVRDSGYLLAAFTFVLLMSSIYVALESFGITKNKEIFVGTQFLLTVLSSIFGWRMR